MKITKEFGASCNFCDRGKLAASGKNLIYPYDFVFVIEKEKSGLSARICGACLNELKKIKV